MSTMSAVQKGLDQLDKGKHSSRGNQTWGSPNLDSKAENQQGAVELLFNE